jgi:hypothetical protein
MKTFTLWALAGLALGGAAQADTVALQRCRIIPEASARLACYDAIALPGIGSRAGWGAPTTTAPAPAATPSTAPADPAGSFGFENRVAAAGPDRLESRVIGKVQGLDEGTRFRLENGQVWAITERTGGFYNLDNPKVAITRGALGNFFMTIEGANGTPRVRRVQ